MKTLDKDKLKSGDVVGIVPIDGQGWTRFRYPRLIEKTISRITPARTKFIMTDGTEYDKYTVFYDLEDEETRYQSGVAECATTFLINLYKMERKKAEIFRKKDRTIIAIDDLMARIVKLLEEDE